MQAMRARSSGSWNNNQLSGRNAIAKISSCCGIACLVAMTAVAAVQPKSDEGPSAASGALANTAKTWRDHLFDPARAVGGYGGIAHTHPAVVRIKKSDGDVTVRDFDWIGKPFTAPIYYGARIWRWASFG